jgi:hypothetical protein
MMVFCISRKYHTRMAQYTSDTLEFHRRMVPDGLNMDSLVPTIPTGRSRLKGCIARAGEKADADALADLPTANAGSHRVNSRDDLVAGYTRISNARETSLDCRGVRVANTARLERMRTWSWPGSRSGRLTSANSPGLRTSMAL